MKKVALITGASKGIGLGLAKILLAHDYEVIGSSRSGEIEGIQHNKFHAIQLDVSDAESIDRCAKSIKASGKKIDLFINNAGIGPDLGTNFPEEKSFEQTFNVNVKGAVLFTESLVDTIKDGGVLLNVSSKMGSINLCDRVDSIAYRMSKSALNMYTKILSNRYADKFKVAAIHPGWVKTTITENTLLNARLTTEESAKRIYDFLESEFKHGVFWDAESGEELEW